jgi:uncharacterized protein (TIGR03000 family)
VWFEGKKMTATGTDRAFRSPPLEAGQRYLYDVRARWREHGHLVTQTRQVKVRAGADVNVTFPSLPARAHARADTVR